MGLFSQKEITPEELAKRQRDLIYKDSGAKALRTIGYICNALGIMSIVFGILAFVAALGGHEKDAGPMIISTPIGIGLVVISAIVKALSTIAEAAAIYKWKNNG